MAPAIQPLLDVFLRRIDSATEAVLNASGGPLAEGEIVRISANNAVAKSQANLPANLQGTVGAVKTGGAAGAMVDVAIGKARVLLEPALVPLPGDTLYLSAATPGRATTIPPAIVLAVGVLKDVATYAIDGLVVADVGFALAIMPGPFPGFGPAPDPVDIGDPGAAGGSGLVSRSDHQHAVPAPVVAPPAVAVASAIGAATTPARSDHTHQGVTDVGGTSGSVGVAAPVSVDKSANAAGAAATVSRSDHKHDVSTAAPTAAVDIGDAAAEGVATTIARSDHEHAVPAPLVAPPAVAVASAIGAATTPARSDHTHANRGDVLFFGNDNIAATADTRYLNPGREVSAATTTLGEMALPMARAGTARNLFVRHNASVGTVGTSVVYTLMLNGVATALTVTIVLTGAAVQGSDLANTVAVAQGDLLELRAVKAASIGNGAQMIAASLEYA